MKSIEEIMFGGYNFLAEFLSLNEISRGVGRNSALSRCVPKLSPTAVCALTLVAVGKYLVDVLSSVQHADDFRGLSFTTR